MRGHTSLTSRNRAHGAVSLEGVVKLEWLCENTVFALSKTCKSCAAMRISRRVGFPTTECVRFNSIDFPTRDLETARTVCKRLGLSDVTMSRSVQSINVGHARILVCQILRHAKIWHASGKQESNDRRLIVILKHVFQAVSAVHVVDQHVFANVWKVIGPCFSVRITKHFVQVCILDAN
jgi:hypothetical protein